MLKKVETAVLVWIMGLGFVGLGFDHYNLYPVWTLYPLGVDFVKLCAQFQYW